MKKTIIALIILVIAAIATYYSVFNGNTANTPVPKPALENQASPTSETIINVKDFAFNPATFTVKIGTKITWINNDNVPHTITSDSGNLLNSPNLAPGNSFSFTFTDIGIFKYHCNIHKMMKGEIIIQN